MSYIDSLSGRQFELFIGKLMRCLGYTNVAVTRAVDDDGLDVIATDTTDRSLGIQCKHLSVGESAGFRAVEETYTGKAIYHTDIGILLTNRRITPRAFKNAHLINIRCWNRNVLRLLIDIANNVKLYKQTPRLLTTNYTPPAYNNYGTEIVSIRKFVDDVFAGKLPPKVPSSIMYHAYINWCKYHNISRGSTKLFEYFFGQMIRNHYIKKPARIDNHDFDSVNKYLDSLPVSCTSGPIRLTHPKLHHNYRCYTRIK